MKKSTFTNQPFYRIIVSILGGLLAWNAYLTISQSQLIGILPIVIQCALLTLILKKHEYTKVGIKIWAILFLSIASGLQFLGRLIQDFAKGFEHIDIQHYLTTGITIMVGILIVIYTNRTVEIQLMEVEKSST